MSPESLPLDTRVMAPLDDILHKGVVVKPSADHPVEPIRLLASLWQGGKPSREVKRVVHDHVADLDRRIARLTAMRDALQGVADACPGDHRAECPILLDLEGARRVEPAARPA